jgi:hypothetical protein
MPGLTRGLIYRAAPRCQLTHRAGIDLHPFRRRRGLTSIWFNPRSGFAPRVKALICTFQIRASEISRGAA